MEQLDNLNHRYTKAEVEARIGITIKEIIRADTDRQIDQTAMTEDSLGKINPVRDMNRTLGGVTLGEMLETLTDEIIEENIVAILETGIDPEKGHYQETIAKSLEIEVQAVVDLGQDQGQVLIETEFNATSVKSTTILQVTVPLLKKREKYNSYSKC